MANNNKQRTFTYLFEIKSDGKQVAEIKRSVKDIDETLEHVNKTVGDNITVTAKRISNDKEALRQTRKAITESNKLARNTDKVTDYYKRLNVELSKADPNLEVVNAQMRAGVSASSEQGKEIERLVTEYQRLRNEGDASTTSMRRFQGIVQNVGWQMQDTVVQLQAGTNGFVVLSQQGSQIASSFGPGGAVLGAIIALGGAIGGMLFAGLMNAKDATEELEDAQKSLNKIIDVSNGKIEGYADNLVELAKIDAELAKAKMRVGIIESTKALESLAEQLVDITDIGVEGSEFADLSVWGRMKSVWSDSADIVNDLGEEFGITTSEARDLVNATIAFRDTKNIDSLRESVVQLSEKYGTGNEKLNEYIGSLVDLLDKGKDASAVYQDLVKRLDDMNIKTKGQNEESDKQKDIVAELIKKWKMLNETFYFSEQQLDKYNAAQILTEAGHANQIPTINQLISDVYKLRDAREEEAAVAEEAERRRKTMGRIEVGVQAQLGGGDVYAKERELFEANMLELRYLRAEAGAENIQEQKRINGLIEAEQQRHSMAISQLHLEQAQQYIGMSTQALGMLNQLSNMLSAEGMVSMKAQMDEMSNMQKGIFILMQLNAAAMSLVNGIDLGMKMAAFFGNPALLGVGTALGAASAGAIMGVTFAGAFDKGGNIPTGQMGVVSEYGDELVNGVLVKGPARVTSREDTAKIMNQGAGGGSSTINQYINVTGNGDKALTRAMKKAAREGADEGYARVQHDFRTGRGIRKTMMKSGGV